MILQELIRNIVLYKGFIQPFIQSVREYLFVAYNTSQSQIVRKRYALHSVNEQDAALLTYDRSRFIQKNASFSLESLTGTRTIPKKKLLLGEDFSTIDEFSKRYLATDSNATITMLMSESPASSVKTLL